MTNGPPKPRFAISIGVIGHRSNRLPEQGRSIVKLQIRDVLKKLAQAAEASSSRNQSFLASEGAAVTLISALAEGADRMAAEAAVEQHLELFAILPFAIDCYEEDFKSQSSVAEYRRLIGKAARVLELCGSRKRKQNAYENVGLTILDNSDTILAVWDGLKSAGPGGTTELLEIAFQRGLPIIYIDSAGKHPPRLLWNGQTKYPVTGVDLAELPGLPLADTPPEVFAKLLWPPSDQPAPDQKK